MTECSRCGDCCDPVTLSVSTYQCLFDEEYEIVGEKNIRTRKFAQGHWKAIARTDKTMLIQCDMFNKKTRLCEAHETRPPICSDYPWYDKDPMIEGKTEADDYGIPATCSFLADVNIPIQLIDKRKY